MFVFTWTKIELTEIKAYQINNNESLCFLHSFVFLIAASDGEKQLCIWVKHGHLEESKCSKRTRRWDLTKDMLREKIPATSWAPMRFSFSNKLETFQRLGDLRASGKPFPFAATLTALFTEQYLLYNFKGKPFFLLILFDSKASLAQLRFQLGRSSRFVDFALTNCSTWAGDLASAELCLSNCIVIFCVLSC